MFDLEKQICEWRQHMSAGGLKSGEALDELESHLREELMWQLKLGLDERAAFESAVQQIGRADIVVAEFAKGAERKEKRERKLKFLIMVYAGLSYLAPLALSAPHLWQQWNPTERWLGGTAVAVTEIFLFSGLFLYPLLPVIREKRTRTQIQFSVFALLLVWLCVFAFGILGRLELTLSQITVTTLWGISPLAVVGGLFAGLDEAAYRRRAHA